MPLVSCEGLGEFRTQVLVKRHGVCCNDGGDCSRVTMSYWFPCGESNVPHQFLKKCRNDVRRVRRTSGIQITGNISWYASMNRNSLQHEMISQYKCLISWNHDMYLCRVNIIFFVVFKLLLMCRERKSKHSVHDCAGSRSIKESTIQMLAGLAVAEDMRWLNVHFMRTWD